MASRVTTPSPPPPATIQRVSRIRRRAAVRRWRAAARWRSRIAGHRRTQAERGPRLLVAIALGVVASLVWVELPVAALTTTVPPLQRVAVTDGLDWLSTANQHIVDSLGRTVVLRGFNTSTLLEGTVLRSPLDDTDASMMEGAGFDVVRLAVSWGRLEPERGVWDTSYLDDIASTVAMLNRHHLWVVIDMHFLDWSSAFGGSGAPAWASLPLLPNPQLSWLGDWQRHISPAVNGAYTYFWLSPDWQTDFFAAWQHIAARFRDDSGVAGYDLFNEPHALPFPPVRFDKDLMWPLYAHTIDAIGSVDPNHLFFVEGELFGDFGTTVVPLSAPNLVYSPHEYTGSLVPPTFVGNASALDAHVQQVAREAAEVPAAMWVGEWGMPSTQKGAMQWVDDAIAAFTKAGAGWAWWQWREDSAWAVRDTVGNVNSTLLRHLEAPYLVAAPPGTTAALFPDPDPSATLGISLQVTVAPSTNVPIVVAFPDVSPSVGTGAAADCIGTTATYDTARGQWTVLVTSPQVCHITFS